MPSRRVLVDNSGGDGGSGSGPFRPVLIGDTVVLDGTDVAISNDDLETHVNALGGSTTVIRVRSNSNVAVNSDLTVPATVSLVVERGGMLTIASGVTLTINGNLEAGLYQIFDTSAGGTVSLGNSVTDIYPEWWGVTYGSDCTTALLAVFTAAVRKTIHLANQTYQTSDDLLLSQFGSLEAHGSTLQAITRTAGQVWQVDTSSGTSFTDETTDFNDSSDGDVQPFANANATGDWFAIGHTRTFAKLIFDYANGTAGIGGVVTWEYWNGSAWTALSNVTDDTTGFTVATADSLAVIWDLPSDWATTSLNGSAALYYVRARVTTGYSTLPVLDQGYLAPKDVLRYPAANVAPPTSVQSRVKNLTIDGNNVAHNCFFVNGGASFTRGLDNCRAIDATYAQFHIFESIGGFFGPNLYGEGGQYGVLMRGCNASHLISPYISSTSVAGIYVTSASSGGQGVTVSSAVSEANTGYACQVDVDGCTLLNMWIEASTLGGILAENCDLLTIVGGRFNGSGSPGATNRWLRADGASVQVLGARVSTQGVTNWGVASLVNSATLVGYNADSDATDIYIGAYAGALANGSRGQAGSTGRIFVNSTSGLLEYDDGSRFHRLSRPITPYAYGAVGDGVTGDASAVIAADDAAAAAGVPLLIPPGNFKIASTITLEAEVVFQEGALFSGVGSDITFEQPISAGNYQIFDAVTMTIRLEAGDANVMWWNALADDSTNNTTAFGRADAAITNGGSFGRVRIPAGVFRLGNTTSMAEHVVFEAGSLIRFTNTVTAAKGITVEDTKQHFDLTIGGSPLLVAPYVKMDVRWFGAEGDGSTDDRAAFYWADQCAAGRNTLRVPPATASQNYVIGSDLTLTAECVEFDNNAILKPSSGVALTINGEIKAGAYQIFDTSASGTITLADTSQETWDEWFDDDTPWSAEKHGSHGEIYEVRTVKTLLSSLSGATVTWSNAIPAGSEVLGLTARVTTLITGATSFDIGDGTDVNRWGASIAVAANTTVNLADMTDFTRHVYSAATSVVLTANGSNFSGGAVRLVLYYRKLGAPTS